MPLAGFSDSGLFQGTRRRDFEIPGNLVFFGGTIIVVAVVIPIVGDSWVVRMPSICI
jgi:hypothetical protein